MNETESSVKKLLTYIESQSYKGYDPYDALKSPLFELPVFIGNKLLRFGLQQLVKRSPFNPRPLLFIPKGYNPVTLGLCIQSYTSLMEVFPREETIFNNKIIHLISELKNMVAPGFHGACWGYDFDWEARHTSIPAFQPTVVATGIISNALYKYYDKTGNPDARDLCISASGFVLNDLQRTLDNNTFCFSYSPFDTQRVYNASAKGIRILSQAYAINREDTLKITARKAVDYILDRQQPDGSWQYSETGKWIDNYHSGYVLDCLSEYMDCTGDASIGEKLLEGFEYYQSKFFTLAGIPKLFVENTYPVDCTAAGQSLLTLIRFKDRHTALKIANWMIGNMQSSEGYFYYRKSRFLTNKTSFMRWSNAWMLAGLSELLRDKYKYGDQNE